MRKRSSSFTAKQWSDGLLPEIDSARRVLDSADRLLREADSLTPELDAVLATYSIGVERLLKLALGTAAVARGEPWPDMHSKRKGWGHALDEMDTRLRDTIREAIVQGVGGRKPILHSWICTLDNDPVWAASVRALRNYADAGRYHHLSQIAGKRVDSNPSWEMWSDIETTVIDNDVELRDQYERGQDIEAELRTAIADSIKRWVSLVCLFGMHSLLGEDWKSISSQLSPADLLQSARVSPGCDEPRSSALSRRLPDRKSSEMEPNSSRRDRGSVG